MALKEIRETIQGRFEFNDLGFGIVQKKIALEPGMKHTIMHLDYMDDNGFGWSSNTTQGMQVYLTNYPIRIQNNRFARGWAGGDEIGGPYAGENSVLFKRMVLYNNQTGNLLVHEFPNDFLAGQETFTFYSNQLYLTIVHYRADETQPNDPYGGSIYIALDSEDVDPVVYGMGVLGEWSDHQWSPFTRQGVGISNGEIRAGMPEWRRGGLRPEIMGLSTDIDFFKTYDPTVSEGMIDSATMRIFTQQSRTMVLPDAAFGTAGTNVPDWYRSVVKAFPGFTIGELRDQFPPVLKADNGNTRMV